MEASLDSHDAPCPSCGHLLWFTGLGLILAQRATVIVKGTPKPEVQRAILPDDLTIPPDVVAMCPRHVASVNCVLPIDYSGDKLLIAMHDPENIEKVDTLRFGLNRVNGGEKVWRLAGLAGGEIV